MATKIEKITQGEMISLLDERFDGKFTKAQVKEVLNGVVAEVEECLGLGLAVDLLGLVKIEPKYKPAKKKGEMVRNPFDGTEKKREKGEPAKLVAKARALARAHKAMPGLNTKTGKEIAAVLTAK